MLRVVFMGTPDFAVPTLAVLTATHDVVGVYTRPDSVSRRGSKTHPSPVKVFAEHNGLEVRQPTSLRDPAVQNELRTLAPDVIVVAAYGLILPSQVLEIPPLGCINVHGSLLPRWRGAAPVQRAILAGDEVTGVSIMRMEEGLDTGPFCERAVVPVDDKNAAQLTAELAQVGADTLAGALDAIADGTCEWTVQVESLATYADKIDKTDVALEPDLTVTMALRRVQASSPQAPARAVIADRGVIVLSAERADCVLEPGSVALSKAGLCLGFSDGAAIVTRLKPDGKAEMTGSAWARGLQGDTALRWTARTH